MNKERFDKLPKWIRAELEQANRIIEILKAELSDRTNLPESPFKHSPRRDTINRNLVNLPEQHCVTIVLPSKNHPDYPQHVEIRVSNDLGFPTIYVMAERGIRYQGTSYNTAHLIPEGF